MRGVRGYSAHTHAPSTQENVAGSVVGICHTEKCAEAGGRCDSEGVRTHCTEDTYAFLVCAINGVTLWQLATGVVLCSPNADRWRYGGVVVEARRSWRPGGGGEQVPAGDSTTARQQEASRNGRNQLRPLRPTQPARSPSAATHPGKPHAMVRCAPAHGLRGVTRDLDHPRPIARCDLDGRDHPYPPLPSPRRWSRPLDNHSV